MKKLFATLLLCASTLSAQHVICVHGFMGFPKKMIKLARELKKSGHTPHLWGYPSRDQTIGQHIDDFVNYLVEECAKAPDETFSFVTHSLGGIIVRGALNEVACPEQALHGRVVMIAPPNRGCHLARKLGKNKTIKKFMGDQSGRELIADSFERVGKMPASVDVMVIAGISMLNPALTRKGDNDALILVEETTLDTPHVHKLVMDNHNQIVYNKKAIELTTKFINAEN